MNHVKTWATHLHSVLPDSLHVIYRQHILLYIARTCNPLQKQIKYYISLFLLYTTQSFCLKDVIKSHLFKVLSIQFNGCEPCCLS